MTWKLKAAHRSKTNLGLHRLEARDVPTTVAIQQGLNGHTGTVDTYINETAISENKSADVMVFADGDTDNTAGNGLTVLQGLIRFDNLIGNGPTQIPAGALINSAALKVSSTDAGGGFSTPPFNTAFFHRLLQPFDAATVTWANTFGGNGVQTNDVEAQSGNDATSSMGTGFVTTTDFAALVSGWVNGTVVNNGLLISNLDSNGWGFQSSEAPVVTNRPSLIVDYTNATSPGFVNFTGPAFSVSEDGTQATITVVRNGTLGKVEVDYLTTAGGTAIAGTDFTTAMGTLVFEDGNDTASFTIDIADDLDDNADLTVNLKLTNAQFGVTLGPVVNAVLTIADNDENATAQFAGTAFGGIEFVGTAKVTVSRGGNPASAVTLTIADLGTGSASAGVDYGAVPTSVVIPAGKSSAFFTIPIVNDKTFEGTETINLKLTAAAGGTLGSPDTATVSITELVINEVWSNPSGTDNRREYIEILGEPGATLDNVYVTNIRGDSGNALGNLSSSTSLTGKAIGSNGLLIVASALAPFLASIPAATTIVPGGSAFDDTAGTLAGGTNTYAIIFSPTVLALTSPQTDLDLPSTGGDGILDLPSGAFVINAVGVTDDSSTGDKVYNGPTVRENNSGTNKMAEAFSRIVGDYRVTTEAAFYAGFAADNFDYDPITVSNGPVGAKLTPGAPNFSGAAASKISSVVVNGGATTRSNVTTLTVTFDQVVTFTGTPEAAFALNRLSPTTGVFAGATGPVTLAASVANGATTVVTLTFSGSLAEAGSFSLIDGNYQLSILSAGVTGGIDGNGDGTGGDNFVSPNPGATGDIFRIYGDTTGSRTVDITDFNDFRSVFNAAPGTTGLDIDGSGVVDIIDFNAFRTRFNLTLPLV